MWSLCMLPNITNTDPTCNINPLAESSKSTSIKYIGTTTNIIKETAANMENAIDVVKINPSAVITSMDRCLDTAGYSETENRNNTASSVKMDIGQETMNGGESPAISESRNTESKRQEGVKSVQNVEKEAISGPPDVADVAEVAKVPDVAETQTKTAQQKKVLSPEEVVRNLYEEKEEDRVLSIDIKTKAPILKGNVSMKDKRIIWEGLWGMNETAFENENGITSKFEMISQDAPHPRLLDFFNKNDGDRERQGEETVEKDEKKAQKQEQEKENNPISKDETDAFFYHTFDGYFLLQTSRRPVMVTEKNLLIGFLQSTKIPSEYYVRGKGTNRFGEFMIKGTLRMDQLDFVAYKIYIPSAESKSGSSSNSTSTSSNSNPNATPNPPKMTRQRLNNNTLKKTSSAASSSLSTTTSTSSSALGVSSLESADESNASLPKRSERKRSLPAHLRDDTIIPGAEMSSKLDIYMSKCMTTLQYLLTHTQASAFISPVDPIALNIPDYFEVIKEPMDLTTIRKEIESGELNDIFEFARKIRLVFNNAITYNKSEHPIHLHAQRLLTSFDHRFRRVVEFYDKENKASGKSSYATTSANAFYAPRSDGKRPAGSLPRGGKGPRTIARGNAKKTPKQTQIEMMRQEIEMMRAELNSLQAHQTIVPSKKGNPTGGNRKKRSGVAGKSFRIENLTDEDLNRPMTMNEKRELSININRLPQAKIDKVVTIIGERIPLDRIQTPNDEIEIDLNSCDNSTLRIIEAYVNDALVHIKKRKRTTNSSNANANSQTNGSSARNSSFSNNSNNIAIAGCITTNLELAQKIELTTKEKIRNVQEELDALDRQTYLKDYKQKKAKTNEGESGSKQQENEKKREAERERNKQDILESESSSSESEELSSDSDSDDEDDVTGNENISALHPHTLSDRSDLLRHDEVLRVENINVWENMISQKSEETESSSSKGMPLTTAAPTTTTTATSLWSTAVSLEKDRLSKEKSSDDRVT